MLEELKKRQKRVYRILESALKNDRLSHFYLLAGTEDPLKLDTAFLLASSILEERRDFSLESSNTLRRMKEGNHFDFCFVDGSKESIKKEMIEDVFSRFQKTGLESKRRVLLIRDVENSRPIVSNMLLKFIEEPKAEVYVIIVTDALDSVLMTIRSRAQIIKFDRQDEEYLMERYKEAGYDVLDAYLLSKIMAEFQTIDDEAFMRAKDVVYNTIETLDDVEYLEIMYQKEVYSYMKSKTTEHFKTFLIMYLKILRTYLDDSLTDSPITDEVYCDDLKILKAHKPSKLLEEVLDILSKTDYNYDRRSLMDKLAYRIVKISKGDKE